MQKILIVDDDARMRRAIKEILAGLAGKVSEAGDGGEAIAICAAERPDWVLMDVRMKPVDGLRATAAIKSRFPEIRVAIVTQYDDAELRAEAARAGAGAYVLKEDLHELPQILLESAQESAAMPDALLPPPLANHTRPDHRRRL